MLDNLRDSATNSPFFSEEGPEQPEEEQEKESTGEKRFLGMTAVQRFIIILLLFFLTCVLGAFCLLVTGKMVLPV
jgi:hypothetical protein